ncbi:hypothetical protein A3I46_02970 [Candidatus Kaiserbacteria bacterium RIFCSPLOWO2_02_FULL_54_13]|uniref:Uncharacterized protein n=1 Tax=Candidatus Kaiserbacteria bacterium RIFCSPHIGHO2_02_FULL_54_22 TaxID=1798495 RepID=A0A1F6DNE7_9BACT|nr:MAG: hypothetical protein UY91_C0005G0006 [Parcubacteria group bacterium GW2011_GWB1_55_9]OGG62926.1 MAG: hypothetical protein A3C19_02315 [Candidatus Kaiserbacteria bacterium RIFCSPHIGHO2_02_FULL_54_22]OGG68023.1 MAG: hypothetical protein A3E99_01910 [Candidatus Kaiserbacteria bacterium RIFCSPHIGHO2_12_FULL_54_16]OGG83516.1 MAG: hypothetical protein A3I46_02970 [Candidatus Kaiserbacteria bacterium RIFCSPLOWO2_02_FULL_54_13]
MDSDGDSEGGGDTKASIISVPPRREIPHYHGDETRVIFVVSAIVLIVAQSTGADLPLSTAGSVMSAVLLVIAAGVTNPAQHGIHWTNACIATAGTILFGITAIDRYRAGVSIFEPSFIYVEALALLSLIALYFTTRTIRGIRMRPKF